MTDNPYEAPAAEAGNLADDENGRPLLNPLRVPARFLIALSVFALIVVVNALPTHMASFQFVAEEEARDVSSIVTSIVILAFMFLFGAIVLVGAVSMLRLRSYRAARLAAIVAMVPVISPLVVLGVPFGIWAMALLGRPEVKARFRK